MERLSASLVASLGKHSVLALAAPAYGLADVGRSDTFAQRRGRDRLAV